MIKLDWLITVSASHYSVFSPGLLISPTSLRYRLFFNDCGSRANLKRLCPYTPPKSRPQVVNTRCRL